jgi:hypothetical protein
MPKLSIARLMQRVAGRFGRKSMSRYGVFLLLLPGACPASSAWAEDLQSDHYCVDVEVDGERRPPLECLNRQLLQTAHAASPADSAFGVDAVLGHGEPNKVGTFSYTGESIRMGSNFGKSAFPQRPTETYAPVIGPTRP